MNPLQFELNFYADDWKFLVDVITKDCLEIDDISYDIYMVWKDEKGKQVLNLLPCSHPFYRDTEIREMAEDKVQRYFYENKQEVYYENK